MATNNALNSPLDDIAITGGTIDGTVIGGTTPAAADFTTVDIVHTAAQAEDHALEIDMNAAGFGDTKSLDIDYVTGALAANSESSVVLINIDDTGSTGGEVIGVDVLVTPGLTAVIGMRAGALVKPIEQISGTFGDADSILNKAVDVTANLANGGGGGITIFVADNDTVTVGDAATFFEISWELTTPSSGAGVAPTWEFSTGSGTWASFTPTDGTNGFRNTGVQAWDVSDVPAWAVGTSGDYLIRITRTRNSLSTTPVAFETQIATVTEYGWDENADVNINNIYTAGSSRSGVANDNTLDIGGTSFSACYAAQTNSSGDSYCYLANRHTDTAALPAAMVYARSRGTYAAQTVVQSGDVLGTIAIAGHDGTDYVLASTMTWHVNGTPGSNDMPGEMRINITPDGSATPAEQVSVDENGLQLGAANARVTTIIDDDSMATASATNLSTSEAIKAYVDAAVGSGAVGFESSLLLMGG